LLDGFVPPLIVLATGAALAALRWRLGARLDVVIVAAIVGVAMFLEHEMGRTPTYAKGPVRLWSGDIHSDQNSQQIFDPYSFTHVVHGAAFYGLSRAVLRGAGFGPTAIFTATLEAAWEVYENTDTVVDRYRSETISLGYYGDSMLNSFFDIVACLFGLALAWRRPARITLAWVVVIEVVLALWIRDNLTLNIVMLIHPIRAIKAWQMGA
jgi:uncharacterized protein DUF2585